MSAVLIVRAEVPDPAERGAFERWYGDEHLPDAVREFGARRGWRGWSETDAKVHFAFYEFDDVEAARAVVGSAGLARLVADFDRNWGDRVSRSREIVACVQSVAGG